MARLLDSGDDCGALAESNRLRNELTLAINQELIPQQYRRGLSAAVKELREQIVCRPAPSPPPPSQGEVDGDEKGKRHEKEHRGHDGDDE